MTSSTATERRLITIDTAMSLIVGEDRYPVSAQLTYCSDEPFSLGLSLVLGDADPVDWMFSRDLLLQGVRLPAGHGDIQIYPTRQGIAIVLHSPDGDAELLADPEDLIAFAEAVEAVVPLGRESDYYCLDAELACLLAFTGQDPMGR